jgi:hypothetical protein
MPGLFCIVKISMRRHMPNDMYRHHRQKTNSN